ncbi:MAG: tail fiber protein [Flavobacterium sp.]|jgi:microcystin-dependent protein
MEEYMGMIKIFAGTFAPRGYMYCAGQLLSIAQYSALYSIIGTNYGGDGRTTFALPDLRSRVPVGGGMGTGPGLPNIKIGDIGGEVTHTLTLSEIPSHNHSLVANNQNATQSAATIGASIATPGAVSGRDFTATLGYNTTAPNTPLAGTSISNSGGSLPHNNMQPFLGISYIICIEGVFPPRS